MTLRLDKTLFLIGIILLCLLIIGFIILVNLPRNESATENATPTPVAGRGQLRNGPSSIDPQEINPVEDISGETIKNPSQKITYTLSEPVSPDEIQVRVTPFLPVKVQQGTNPTDIIVFPDPPDFWAPNVLYTVTITDSQRKNITSYQIKVPRLTVPEIVD